MCSRISTSKTGNIRADMTCIFDPRLTWMRQRVTTSFIWRRSGLTAIAQWGLGAASCRTKIASLDISLQSEWRSSHTSLIRRQRLVGSGCAPVVFIFWCWWSSVWCTWPTRANGCVEDRRYYDPFMITKQLPRTVRGVTKRYQDIQCQTGRLHQNRTGR